jgi:hypothetical protein
LQTLEHHLVDVRRDARGFDGHAALDFLENASRVSTNARLARSIALIKPTPRKAMSNVVLIVTDVSHPDA